MLFPPINLLLILMSVLQLTIRKANVESKAILHLGIITPDKILIFYVGIARFRITETIRYNLYSTTLLKSMSGSP